ncbi:phosphopyruvate hydratase [Candidatus Woesearchaeota archaeon]|nr:phosphopyruvate hydratase [Candidatus Woesearchaeota archaeon]
MYTITNVKAREVLDSRGNPTVEVDVYTGAGRFGREMVPSGASTGVHEALELRDGGKRYHGLGVLRAVEHVNKRIAPRVMGMDVRSQRQIDEVMIDLDGTANKSILGANAIMGVSLACAKAAAVTLGTHTYDYLGALCGNKKFILPAPFMNVINGGKHAGTNIDFQEFMIVPFGKTFAESLRIGTETYHTLRELIVKQYGKESANVGDEGGFTPHCHGGGANMCELVEEPLDLLSEAVESLGYEKQVKFAIDVAASSFYHHGNYLIRNKHISAGELTDVYLDLMKKYPIVSIEDPFHQEAFADFARLTRKVKGKMQVVADDLTVTNVHRIRKAIAAKSANCLLLKINQIGTLTEALDAAQLAKKANWNVMVSHRSGETEDHFISDLAVGLGMQQLKAGAPCRGERTSKYNQLLRIEEKLKAKVCDKDCWLTK